jgi:hypothetical protein
MLNVSTVTGSGQVVGITVPNGVIRVRRNGKECWTGNSGRNTGGYTIDRQPAKGGSTGSKRVGSLDTTALIAHGATHNLQDVQLIRGTRNEDYWTALKMGRPLPEPGVPFIYDKFLATLKAGGVNTTRKGDITTIMPLTDADIDGTSKGEITNSGTVNAKDMSPVSGGLFDRQVTGGLIGDKWSHVTLASPLPNPIMEDPIKKLLGLTEREYRAILSGRSQLNGKTGGRAIQSALASIDLDKDIQKYRDQITATKGLKRDTAVKNFRYLVNAKKMEIHPKDWMISKVPVLPPKFRPVSSMGDMMMVPDINELYRDLIETNNHIKTLTPEVGPEAVAEEQENLYDSVRAAFGLGDPITQEGRSKRLKGAIRQVIGQSPKYGMFQSKVLSKPVDMVGRGAVIPDPNLDMDSLGIPESSCWTLYKPFVTRRLVRRGIQPAKAVEMIEKRMPEAKSELIDEMSKRPVLFTRAPSWHKFNIMAFYPQMVDGDVVHVSPLITSGMNMDFNGDSCEDMDVLCQIGNDIFYGKISELLDKYFIPGYNEDSALSVFGRQTAVFTVKPGAAKMIGLTTEGGAGLVAMDGFSIHTSHGPDCYRIETASGLSGVFTAHHSFSVMDQDSVELREVKTEKIVTGVLLPSARQFNLPEFVTEAPGAPTPCPLNYATGFWFGHYFGDGSLTGRADTVSQASTDAQLLTYLSAIGDSFIPDTAWREGNGYSARWTNVPWHDYLASFGMRCDGKMLPGWMFAAPIEFKKGLIAGMYVAEGSPDMCGGFRFEIVNRRMLVQFKTIIESLGGICRLSDGKKAKGNHKASYILRTNIRSFRDISVEFPASLDISGKFDDQPTPLRNNWDLVPFPRVIARTCRTYGEHLRTAAAWLTKKGKPTRQGRCSDVDSKQFSKAAADGWCTRTFARKVIAGYALADLPDLPVVRWIELVGNESVYWTPVERTAKVARPDVTYDFSLPDMHMFAVAGTTLVHNSANFHVPVSDKAVSEAAEKMLPSRNLFRYTDLKSVQHTAGKEMTMGLYQMTREPTEKAPVVFDTVGEAQKAYEHNLIGLNDPIIIRK